jgi:hypothetical protein
MASRAYTAKNARCDDGLPLRDAAADENLRGETGTP